MTKFLSSVLIFSFFASVAAQPAVHANPSFNQAESGSIQISENGPIYNIYSSDRAIGDFNSFSNVAGETINSIQASSDHTALFRVTGGDPSTIFGAFNANSRIFLVNPNGILFGPGSSVNAPGLVASALNISNNDFTNGNYAFNAASSTGGFVTNQGALSGDYYVVLLGRAVRNEGTITSPGTAALAAGDSARLLLDPDGLVSIDVTAASSATVYNADGSRVSDAIANTGILSADGGVILMTARAAEGIFDNVINHSGIAQARSVGVENGVVTFYGGDEGIVRVSGVIDASGKDEGEKGGTVHVLGDKVGLFGNAKIDVSGDAGGGEALVGGDYRGDNPDILNADFTYASKDASIDARAIRIGDGGKVIAWGNEVTRFYGSIDARGGERSGNGGFVETSGEHLDVNGIRVSASSTNGLAGTWLLDPLDITITGTPPDSNVDDDFGLVDRTISPNAAGALLQASTINTALNNGTNVTVTTVGTGTSGSGDITVSSSINNSIAKGASLTLEAAGSITLNSATITMAAGGDLTLDAGQNINLNNPITVSGGFLELIAGNAVNGDGSPTNVDINAFDSVKITADKVGSGTQLDIFFTNDGNGPYTFELNNTNGVILAGPAVNVEIQNQNFDTYKVKQDFVTTNVTLDLSGLDLFSVTGTATDVTLNSINLANTGIKPTLDYTLNDTGDIKIGSIVLGTAKSLSIEATDGDILDNTSSITAGATTLTASGDIGTPGVGINLSVASIAADAGGDIFVRAPSGNLVIGVIDAGDGAGDVRLEAAIGSIQDANADDLNVTADNLTFITGAGNDVGTSADPIEATYNSLDTSVVTANGDDAYITRIIPEDDDETNGLLIVDGKIVGGENIDDLITSLYGEEESGGEDESEDSEDDQEVVSDSAASVPGENLPVEELAADASTPVSQQAFSPCGV